MAYDPSLQAKVKKICKISFGFSAIFALAIILSDAWNLITPTIEVAKSQGAGLDGKTALQELAAARQISLPEYQISESGPDHDKSFVATAIVGGEAIATGSGKSKREAEQAAARTAFEILNARTT